jgi:DNA invertase Pin-like site-specific DNA recombinase
MKAAVAYCRSAVETQGTPSSARRQAAALARYATRHRLKLRATYMDAGVSGATLSRPALGQLLADCRAGKVGTVLIRDPDRLSRNSDHLLLLLAKFEAAGVRLEFTTPAGRKRFEFTKILWDAAADLVRATRLERQRLCSWSSRSSVAMISSFLSAANRIDRKR